MQGWESGGSVFTIPAIISDISAKSAWRQINLQDIQKLINFHLMSFFQMFSFTLWNYASKQDLGAEYSRHLENSGETVLSTATSCAKITITHLLWLKLSYKRRKLINGINSICTRFVFRKCFRKTSVVAILIHVGKNRPSKIQFQYANKRQKRF